jgi:hypothetical protein
MRQLGQNQKTRRGSKAGRRRVPARSELQKELTEAVRHRAAVSEVLRAIARSPHDLQPVFDTIIGSAMRICRANVGTLRLYEQKGLRLVAQLVQPNTLLERWTTPVLLAPTSSLWAHIANGLPGDARDPLRSRCSALSPRTCPTSGWHGRIIRFFQFFEAQTA